MKMTRIRLRSLGTTTKDVVAVPAAALGNDGVAEERGVVVISGPRSVFTHARASSGQTSQSRKKGGSTERETDDG